MPGAVEKPTHEVVGVWFRKCLRLHDNAPLLEACRSGKAVLPFFILDPWFDKTKVGINRFAFLLESLRDLDEQLRRNYGSRLLVLRGQPEQVFREQLLRSAKGASSGKVASKGDKLPAAVKLDALYYEYDSEPYSLARDEKIDALAKTSGAIVQSFAAGHTILDLEKTCVPYLSSTGGKKPSRPPTDMRGISSLAQQMLPGSAPQKLNVPKPQAAPKSVPSLPFKPATGAFQAPGLAELYPPKAVAERAATLARLSSGLAPKAKGGDVPGFFRGGETEALRRLEVKVGAAGRTDYVCSFRKPQTASTNEPGKPLEPHTTGLSMYLKFGCLSPRKLWHAVEQAYARGRAAKKPIAQPPESLHGQLLFRELFYVLGRSVPNWDQGEGNSMCRVIDWDLDPARPKTATPVAKERFQAWREGRTGYPFIDALMRQLAATGWMHHLGRHAVACFLTRGDIYTHWQHGRDVFDELLLDSDWSLNNANWLWLAGVAPFSSPYFRVYNPAPAGQSALNAAVDGDFIRFWVPELKGMPAKYVYSPWEAPLEVQKAAKCLVGKDYPKPIVEHKSAVNSNLARFKKALSSPPKAVATSGTKRVNGGGGNDGAPSAKRSRNA